VRAAYRGRGIGEELVRRSLAWMDEQGARKITIGVVLGNEEALPLYEKFGFYPRAYSLSRPW
jgi:ribosomal protein S18 acetylase RimI-like enzyme